MTNLADQQYWNNYYSGINFEIAPEHDQVRRWIEKYLVNSGGDVSCLEIGCFPGRYLAVFGEFGYELNGIDLSPGVDEVLELWLKSKGYKTGEFIKNNFLTHRFNKKYQVVCSFGFLEHFTEWKQILCRHAELVSDGGYLFVETPNFRGTVQRLLHLLLNRDGYNRHYIPSMRPHEWAEILKTKGFDIIYSGYFGIFDFWWSKQSRNMIQEKLIHKITEHMDTLTKMPHNNFHVSPYCGVIARKTKA